MKDLRSKAQRHRAPEIGIVEGRLVAVDEKIGAAVRAVRSSQIACGAWLLMSFNSGTVSS